MTDPLKAHWAAQIEGLNEICGLLDKACATVIQLEAVEEHEHNKRLRASLYQGIVSSRNFAAEIERATQELLSCRCEGMEHNPDCLASPTRLNRFGDHAIVEGSEQKRDPHGDSASEEDPGTGAEGDSPFNGFEGPGQVSTSEGSGQVGSGQGGPGESGAAGGWKAVAFADFSGSGLVITRQEGGGGYGVGGGEQATPG